MRPEDLRNHFGDLYFCGTRTTWFWSTLCFLILSSSTLGCQNFYMLLLFPRVCLQKIAPPLPKQVRFKNANQTRKLENRTVSFFFQREFQNRSFHPSDRNFYDFVTKKSHFLDFRRLLQFLEAPSRHFPKFRGFWSPAKGF